MSSTSTMQAKPEWPPSDKIVTTRSSTFGMRKGTITPGTSRQSTLSRRPTHRYSDDNPGRNKHSRRDLLWEDEAVLRLVAKLVGSFAVRSVVGLTGRLGFWIPVLIVGAIAVIF